jgi:futalosine hydrolase
MCGFGKKDAVMRILVVAATRAEIAPFIDFLVQNWEADGADAFVKAGRRIDMLISGVGMPATSYSLTKKLITGKGYDLVLQAGIGGSYERSLPLGSVVLVHSELFADLGAEDHYQFRDVYELGLADKDAFPFSNGTLVNPLAGSAGSIALPRVSGLTVNSTTGSAFSAQLRWEKYGCTLESMEGAALHYICLMEGMPFAQVRSISNYVEARNRPAWEIGKAIVALNGWLKEYVDSMA